MPCFHRAGGPVFPAPSYIACFWKRRDLSEAVRVVTEAKRASSCNYLIAHTSGEIKNLEVTPDHYGIIDSQGDLAVHANHFVHPDMVPFEKRPKDKLENSKFQRKPPEAAH